MDELNTRIEEYKLKYQMEIENILKAHADELKDLHELATREREEAVVKAEDKIGAIYRARMEDLKDTFEGDKTQLLQTAEGNMILCFEQSLQPAP